MTRHSVERDFRTCKDIEPVESTVVFLAEKTNQKLKKLRALAIKKGRPFVVNAPGKTKHVVSRSLIRREIERRKELGIWEAD